MRFLIPASMAPGVYRQGVGMFPPGSVLELPDAASHPDEIPSVLLTPLDKEAHDTLKKAYGKDAKAIPADVQKAIDGMTGPAGDGRMTAREAAIAAGAAEQATAKGGRASDSK
jgi:hypothetical protein